MLHVIICRMWAREEGLLEDTGITRLVEGCDAQLLVGVLLNDAKSIVVGIKRSHEDEGYVHAMGRIEMLDLPNSEIEEGHVVLDLERALRTRHACMTYVHMSISTQIKMEVMRSMTYP